MKDFFRKKRERTNAQLTDYNDEKKSWGQKHKIN